MSWLFTVNLISVSRFAHFGTYIEITVLNRISHEPLVGETRVMCIMSIYSFCKYRIRIFSAVQLFVSLRYIQFRRFGYSYDNFTNIDFPTFPAN